MTKTPEELAKETLQKKLKFSPDMWTDCHTCFVYGYDAAKPEWVSVEERLPEDGDEVIVVSDGKTCASWHEAGDFGWAVGGKVTHWMPLPTPPEE